MLVALLNIHVVDVIKLTIHEQSRVLQRCNFSQGSLKPEIRETRGRGAVFTVGPACAIMFPFNFAV